MDEGPQAGTAQVTEWLRAAGGGDAAARERVLGAVYGELRRIARRLLVGDRMRHVLAPTELVHGAALKLIGQEQIGARDRAHFLAYCAQVMRQVLIDQVRHDHAAKRDAGTVVTLVSTLPDEVQQGTDVEVLHEALERLAAVSPPHARLVERRFFAGMTLEEIAAVDGVSEATVKRQWRAARAWLHEALADAR
jgi:RNA polymerase sigma factor (TIGR02999 family)